MAERKLSKDQKKLLAKRFNFNIKSEDRPINIKQQSAIIDKDPYIIEFKKTDKKIKELLEK